ncbi:MAG: helix-turn-helix domain-containing protein [Ilumatobacteraceae bacterium]|nr:helix-turn-helix domain-containing protein [Ilumatobacteraceae bacterium]
MTLTTDDRRDPTDHAVPRSVGRVLDLLEVVLGTPGCTLTNAADACELTPTTALRHLRALEARGYVERDRSGIYSVGPTMSRLTAALGDDDPIRRLVAAAQPHLDALAASTGESAYLAVSDGRTATYVAAAESDRAIRHVGWVGQNVPLDGTALGAALAAPGTCATRTGAVEPDITAVSVALPVPGTVGVALSVIGPQHRFDETNRREHERALLRSAATLSRHLGASDEVAS